MEYCTHPDLGVQFSENITNQIYYYIQQFVAMDFIQLRFQVISQ